MSQIKEIITTLLNTHERGSLAYLGKYIHLTSEGKVSQEQSKQYAEMLLDYNDYLDDKEAYEGVYLSLFDSFETDDFATGIGKFIETSGLGKFEDGDGFARGLFATEEVLEYGAEVDDVISHYKLPETDMIQDEAETVKMGLECGIRLGNYLEYEVGDIIECYELEKVEQTL